MPPTPSQCIPIENPINTHDQTKSEKKLTGVSNKRIKGRQNNMSEISKWKEVDKTEKLEKLISVFIRKLHPSLKMEALVSILHIVNTYEILNNALVRANKDDL